MCEETQKDQLKVTNTDVYLHCRGHAAIALNKLNGGELDLSVVMERLSRSVDRVIEGNTNEIQAMLVTQAKSLEYMFYDALTKLPNASMEHAEVFANIALRAQSGCRKALMALAELKHPRRSTTFIKQQNNAITQQVNNGIKSTPEETKINQEKANELIGDGVHEATKLDIGTTIATGTKNKTAEAVEVFDRP